MSDDPTRMRLWLTFYVDLTGIVAIVIVFLVAVLAFHDAREPGQVIAAVIGTVATAIGTLAGLVAGHTAGAAGRERAEQRADAQEQRAQAEADRADIEERDATAGRALATALKADAQTESVARDGAVERHAELARSFFPDAG